MTLPLLVELLALMFVVGISKGQPVINSKSCQMDENECAVNPNWSEDTVKGVVELWEFDAAAEAKLMRLGQMISDVSHWKNDPYEVVRFLVDLNMDVEKSEVAFRKMVQWRLEKNVDTFLERYGEPPELMHYNPTFILKGLDREGDPIFVERTGRLDGWGLHKKLGGAALLDACLFVSELIATRGHGVPEQYDWQRNYYEPQTGRRFRQFTSLVDLEGMNVGQMRPALFGLLKEATRISQDMYPGLVKRFFIIRAPKLFRVVWKLVQHFYDARTRDKFIIVTKDNYLDVLDEYIAREHLPTVIDPIKGKGQPMPGFFEKVHMEGGKIPSDV